jgi:hypothetical protein
MQLRKSSDQHESMFTLKTQNDHVQKDGSLKHLTVYNSQNKVAGVLSNILTQQASPNHEYLQFLNKENLCEFQNLNYGLSANF